MRLYEFAQTQIEDPKAQKSPVGGRNKQKHPFIELSEEQLDEIDWKKALATGATAAALLGGSGAPTTADAAPYQHSQQTDQMTGERQGTVSSVRSDSGDATLSIHHNGKDKPFLWIKLPGKVIHFKAGGSASGRIKIGDEVLPIGIYQASDSSYNWGGVYDYEGRIAKILNHSGKFMIEVPIFQEGNKVYTFTLEKDSITTKSADKMTSDLRAEKHAAAQAEVKRTEQLKADNQEREEKFTKTLGEIHGGTLAIMIKTYGDLPKNTNGITFEITQLGTGEITAIRLVKSSGNPYIDSACERVIHNLSGTIQSRKPGRTVKAIVTL